MWDFTPSRIFTDPRPPVVARAIEDPTLSTERSHSTDTLENFTKMPKKKFFRHFSAFFVIHNTIVIS